jgi:hypothetical protein
MTKYGEMSWKDKTLDSGSGGGKDTFLRLKPGSNVVRVVTRPYLYNQHKYKIPGEKGYGHRINCSRTDNNDYCVVCSKGDRPKKRFFIGVIDRQTNTYRVLDINYGVFKNLQVYVEQDVWGDPSGYDIDIVVNPKAGSVGYYTVVAKPHTALSAADIKLREENSTDDLVRWATPPSSDKVEEKLKKLMEEFSNTTASETQSDSNTEADDTDFTDYDVKPQVSKTVKAPF